MEKLKALRTILVPATIVTAILFSSGASSEVLAKTPMIETESSKILQTTNLNKDLENLLNANIIFKKLEETGEKKTVTINYEGKQSTLETTAKTVALALFQSGIEISEDDEVYPSVDSDLENGQEVLILTKGKSEFQRSIPIAFTVAEEFSIEVPYGERKVIQKGQVGKKIQHYKEKLKNGIIISEEMLSEEVVSEPIEEKVLIGLKEIVQEDVEFEVETRNNQDLEEGKTKVVQNGVKGKRELIYRNDGKTRDLISSKEVSKPKNKIVEIGTKKKAKVSKSVINSPAVNSTSAKYTLSQFKFNGVVHDGGRKFTYYSQSVLPGRGLKIPGRHVNSGGYVADASGYIVLAAGRSIPHGTVINTPFGYKGKVYDTCASCDSKWFDVYIR